MPHRKASTSFEVYKQGGSTREIRMLVATVLLVRGFRGKVDEELRKIGQSVARMETLAAITILTPVLLPVAVAVGVDPVHFGVILILNLMIGLLTPPVGMVLYVLSKVADVPFERCVVATAPFLIPLVAVLLLLTFVPEFSMWLPTMIYRQ